RIDHPADLLRPGAGGIYEMIGRDRAAGGESGGRDGVSLSLEADDLVGHELDANRLRLRPEGHQQAVRVEPAIIRRVHTGPEIFHLHGGPPCLERVWFEPRGVHPHSLLGLEVAPARLEAFWRDDEQAAVLLQPDARP